MAERSDMTDRNTHRAVIQTSVPPSLDLIAAGDAAFCMNGLESWIEKHPLNAWQVGLVVQVTKLTEPLEGAAEPDAAETS